MQLAKLRTQKTAGGEEAGSGLGNDGQREPLWRSSAQMLFSDVLVAPAPPVRRVQPGGFGCGRCGRSFFGYFA